MSKNIPKNILSISGNWAKIILDIIALHQSKQSIEEQVLLNTRIGNIAR